MPGGGITPPAPAAAAYRLAVADELGMIKGAAWAMVMPHTPCRCELHCRPPPARAGAGRRARPCRCPRRKRTAPMLPRPAACAVVEVPAGPKWDETAIVARWWARGAALDPRPERGQRRRSGRRHCTGAALCSGQAPSCPLNHSIRPAPCRRRRPRRGEPDRSRGVTALCAAAASLEPGACLPSYPAAPSPAPWLASLPRHHLALQPGPPETLGSQAPTA